MEDIMKKKKKKRPLNQHDWHTYKSSEIEKARTGPAQGCTSWGPRAERWSEYMAPFLTRKLSPTVNHLQKNLISSKAVSLAKQTTLKDRLRAQQ